MKTIIAGAYGLVTDSLISRLNQELGEVFVITGNKSQAETLHKGVIEEYGFEYDNINIPFILESTKTETVIFMGAMDTGYQWNSQSDAVSYISGLFNIILSAAKAGVKRFIYLSTTEVYQPIDSGRIQEDHPLAPKGLRAMTVKSGEDLVLQYNNTNGMQVILLRCSELYGFFNNHINLNSYCTRICLELIKGNSIYIDENLKHDYIHVSDVVSAIYNAMVLEEIPHTIYNICTGSAMTESLTARIISMLLNQSEEEKYLGDSPIMNYEFSCDLAKLELGLNPVNSTEDGFIQFIKQLKEFEAKKTDKKKSHFFLNIRKNLKSIWGWFFPYFETVAVFAVIELINRYLGSYYFMQAIDLYLLFVVFIAIIYGKGQTTFALILCLAGRMNILQPDFQIRDLVVNYNNYIWLLHLLIIGMGIGYVRDHYKQNLGDKEEEIEYMKAELAEIKEINHSNIRIKKIYENRLINYKDSFARIYSIISKLSDLEPDKILFAAVGVVSQIMNSNEVLLYNVDKSGYYARLAAASTGIKYEVKKSIRLEDMQDIFEEIKKKRVYANRTMEFNKPAMVGGVYHEDKLETIVIIRTLPFESTTLYHMNLFSVVLNLIAQALHNANQYIEENRGIRYMEGTSILTSKAFQTVRNIKRMGSESNLAESCLLEIIREGKTLQQINDIVVPSLRQQDNLGLNEEGRLYLLLSNTNDEESDIVIRRLMEKGIETRKEAL